jgi:murein DD-endopeptidase MepM/ murein hydrolase activator NlpD
VKQGFLVKIIPPQGYTVYRLHFTRRHLYALGALLGALLLTAVGIHTYQLHSAASDIARLQSQREEQQHKLDAMAQQTQALQKQNNDSQRAIEAIQRALGTDRKSAGVSKTPKLHAALDAHRTSDVALQTRLRLLETVSARTHAEAESLQRLAVRVLNMRRLASIAHERLLASIPSLNPVNGFIASTFGYRTSPFREFHKGLDLAAEYGTTVRATAAGMVASAGWDGGYGIKVDIDHGNGYHTWYCHLSHADVTAGMRVTKGEPIARVGSTGESTGPHLHYQVMRMGEAIDPQPFLNGVPASVLATLPDAAEVR